MRFSGSHLQDGECGHDDLVAQDLQLPYHWPVLYPQYAVTGLFHPGSASFKGFAGIF